MGRLSQPVTPERVAEVAPHVGRYRRGSFRGWLADQLVARHEAPTREAVQALGEAYQLRRQRQREQARSLLEQTGTTTGDVRAFIDRGWAEQGHGPTWASLARAMGWSRAQTKHVLHLLAQRGQVHFTREQGSLTTTRHNQAAEPRSGTASGVTPAAPAQG